MCVVRAIPAAWDSRGGIFGAWDVRATRGICSTRGMSVRGAWVPRGGISPRVWDVLDAWDSRRVCDSPRMGF